MQLRRLKEALLLEVTKAKQANGAYISTYNETNSYMVAKQIVTNSTAGEEIKDMDTSFKLISVRNELEMFLMARTNNQEDNISKYRIKLGNEVFKIRTATENYVEVFK